MTDPAAGHPGLDPVPMFDKDLHLILRQQPVRIFHPWIETQDPAEFKRQTTVKEMVLIEVIAQQAHGR